MRLGGQRGRERRTPPVGEPSTCGCQEVATAGARLRMTGVSFWGPSGKRDWGYSSDLRKSGQMNSPKIRYGLGRVRGWWNRRSSWGRKTPGVLRLMVSEGRCVTWCLTSSCSRNLPRVPQVFPRDEPDSWMPAPSGPPSRTWFVSQPLRSSLMVMGSPLQGQSPAEPRRRMKVPQSWQRCSPR